jgi:hypothetical protein
MRGLNGVDGGYRRSRPANKKLGHGCSLPESDSCIQGGKHRLSGNGDRWRGNRVGTTISFGHQRSSALA